jgi:hypothetical protein
MSKHRVGQERQRQDVVEMGVGETDGMDLLQFSQRQGSHTTARID